MTAKKDLTGMKFGRLTVVKEAGRCDKSVLWSCSCVCGGEKICRQDRLLAGTNISCGCAVHEEREVVEMVGKCFGEVQCIRFVESRRDSHQARRFYEFRCKCGNLFISCGAKVRSGATKTCGCGKIDRGKNAAKLAHEKFYKTHRVDDSNKCIWICSLKGGAKTRGLQVDIPDADLVAIAESRCVYCDAEPRLYNLAKARADLKARARGDTINLEYFDAATWRVNGIDRIDSSKGYVEGNCVPCCPQCNTMKLDYSQEDFLAQVKRIYEHMNLGETVKEKV